MIVKALVTFRDGYMTENFVFGGSRSKTDDSTKYEYQLTSYLIDTGEEVILIDTSFTDQIIELPVAQGLGVYTGRRVDKFEAVLNDAGYCIADVDKIILTHSDLDHAGAISLFPDAAIFISSKDSSGLSCYKGLNINAVDLDKNHSVNFDGAYKVAPNIHFIRASGHTKGHSIVVAYNRNENLYYMFSGDVTVSDKALREGDVHLIYSDLEEAKKTVQKVKDFVNKLPTIYLSSHDPKAVDNLKNKLKTNTK